MHQSVQSNDAAAGATETLVVMPAGFLGLCFRILLKYWFKENCTDPVQYSCAQYWLAGPRKRVHEQAGIDHEIIRVFFRVYQKCTSAGNNCALLRLISLAGSWLDVMTTCSSTINFTSFFYDTERP